MPRATIPASMMLAPSSLKMSKAPSHTSSVVSYAQSSGYDSDDNESELEYAFSDSGLSSPGTTPASSPTYGFSKEKERDRRGVATFHLKPFREQTWFEWMLSSGVAKEEVYERKPFIDRGPIEVHSPWRENLWIAPRALGPAILQQLSLYFWPEYKWHVTLSYTVYLFSFFFFMTAGVSRLNHFAFIYGTYDEKSFGRDRPVDRNVDDLFWLNVSFLTGRTFIDFMMHWDQNDSPIESFHWTFPIRLFLYLVCLDYLFYAYHRSAHELPQLWFHHQSHHGTKHPSPLLSIDAISVIAAVMEFLVIPWILTLIIPMSFHELYVTICYTAYTEAAGHSGIRAVFDAPVTGPVLAPFGLEINVEDHDLHHRGGKGGKNYGKQTMIFDYIYGTRIPRIETPDRLFPGDNSREIEPTD